MISFRVITYLEYATAIAPLRYRSKNNWDEAPIHENPWGIVQYYGREVFEKMLVFPIGAFWSDDKDPTNEILVGTTTIYNTSDSVLRFGGIWVHPKYRGNRIGIDMCQYAINLWPEQWNTLIGYYRSDSFMRFIHKWGLAEVKGHFWRSHVINGYRINNSSILASKKIR